MDVDVRMMLREAVPQASARMIPSPLLALDDGIPKGWREIKSAKVYAKAGRLVIVATPDDAYPGIGDDDEHPHNCDAECCGWGHVVGDGRLR